MVGMAGDRLDFKRIRDLCAARHPTYPHLEAVPPFQEHNTYPTAESISLPFSLSFDAQHSLRGPVCTSSEAMDDGGEK
eukprot:1395132-Amorphochlora_amoeboformis.AAC.2